MKWTTWVATLSVAMTMGLALFITGVDSCATPCDENADCGSLNYCAKATGDCDGVGSCDVKPTACTEQYQPVCGCDGQTYDNDCFAASAGVNVAYEGQCAPSRCVTNDDCGEADYCARSSCSDPTGSCEARPEICTREYDPVCGCDGETYSNACTAASAGVNVDYRGECQTTAACTTNRDCPEGNYCAMETCESRSGQCAWMPEGCAAVYDPVCGCDGNTYGNACSAAGSGMNVAYEGECRAAQ